MKWSVDDFVEYLKTPPTSELDAFKRQNTVYAVFILLEALAAGEATFRDGTLTVDDVQYDCKDHLPITAVSTYGFGLGEAYDETVGRDVVGLLEGIYLLRAEETVSALEDAFGEICGGTEGRLDWNYYGTFMTHDSVMPVEWAERATALLTPVVVPTTAPVHVPSKLPRFFSKAHTRRMHGKRALSPIRRTRGTATTRRRSNKHPLTVDATEKL
jgi:hypothetical protein